MQLSFIRKIGQAILRTKFAFSDISRSQIIKMDLFKEKQLAYRPIVIAHRGYSSIFPENTLQSFQVALHRSDLIEFDIVLTKDNQVIVFHDRHLGEITNVKDFEHFKDRKNEYFDNLIIKQTHSVASQDWWVKEFNLQELKTLKVKQRYPKRPQLSKHSFTIPTLEEAFQYILNLKQQFKSNVCGFLIQLKPLRQFEDAAQDSILVQKLIEILYKFDLTNRQKCEEKLFPVVLQSFNLNMVRKLNQSKLNLPIVALLGQDTVVDEAFIKEEIRHNIIGIGVSQSHAKKEIMSLCAQHGKKTLFWSMIDDKPEELPSIFPSYREAYFHLFQLGFNGIITQFPENCQLYFEAFCAKKNNEK